MSLSVIFQLLFNLSNAAFVGLGKSEYRALSTGIQAIIKSALQIGLVVAGLGVTGTLIGHTASFLVAFLFVLPVLMRILSFK